MPCLIAVTHLVVWKFYYLSEISIIVKNHKEPQMTETYGSQAEFDYLCGSLLEHSNKGIYYHFVLKNTLEPSPPLNNIVLQDLPHTPQSPVSSTVSNVHLLQPSRAPQLSI